MIKSPCSTIVFKYYLNTGPAMVLAMAMVRLWFYFIETVPLAAIPHPITNS